MARHLTQLVLTVASAALLAGCSGMTPSADNDAPSRPTSRPMIFGRHAWEADQRIAAERAAAAQAQTPATAQPAPAPVVAQAQPVAPPAPVAAPPVIVAQAPSLAPAPVAPVAPPVVAQPAPVAPPPVAMAEAAPAPVAPVAPAPAKPAKKPGFALFHHDAKPAPAPVAPKAEPAPPVQAVASATPPPAAKPDHKGFSLFGLKPDYGDTQKAPLVGGYGNAPDKAAVEAAAAFAVHESPGYVLKGVYSAKTQVVAGTNYSLCLWVRTPGHEANPLKRRLVSALVFQGLDKHYELTAWHEVETCQAGT